MSKKNLLKFANEKKPAEFSKEFKLQLDRKIQAKLFNREEEEIENDDEGETE